VAEDRKGEWITPAEATACLRTGSGRGVRIAVLDSGIETAHPALSRLRFVEDIAIVKEGQELRTVPGDGRDVFGHGTAVAGIIGEIAPEAEIGSIRVLGERLDSRTAIIAEGAYQAIERGYHILNCSFGCAVPEHVLEYKRWVDLAFIRGIHVVAACNNLDHTRPEWPGYFSSVVTVNMLPVDQNALLVHVPGSMVEFAAPGFGVRVPWRESQIREVSGSSFAAPVVAGLLARLLSASNNLHPHVAKGILRHIAPIGVKALGAADAEGCDSPRSRR